MTATMQEMTAMVARIRNGVNMPFSRKLKIDDIEITETISYNGDSVEYFYDYYFNGCKLETPNRGRMSDKELQDAICKAYSNTGFGSITSNGPATQTKRDPVNISAGGYSAWTDTDAIWEMGQSGYSDIVDGDTVTLYDDQQTTTKQYYGGDWWLSFNATFSSGIGTVNCKSVAQPLTGTIEFVEEDTRPGINEEIKEELKPKRLRDW